MFVLVYFFFVTLEKCVFLEVERKKVIVHLGFIEMLNTL